VRVGAVLTSLFIALACALLASCPQEQEMTVEDALTHIESVEVNALTARVSYVRTDPILDRKELRSGKLLFREIEGKREAAIVFDTLIIGRRKETKQKHYIFSGRWMAEVDHDTKQYIKRELVPPDQKNIDPFDLGSGPIPLPIGQKKESVLKKFDVTFTDKPTEGHLAKIEGEVVGLHLEPKVGDEWAYINLFYDPSTWLPVGVETVEIDGTKRTSRLTDLQLNALTDVEVQLLDIKTPDLKEWSIDVQQLQ
jgi:hypothetical protein